MRFSERYGHKPVRELIQIDSMSKELRNVLWNVLTAYLWDRVHTLGYPYNDFFGANPEIKTLCFRLWHDYWKVPIDSLRDNWPEVFDMIRQQFFACKWYEVYDFLEFVAKNYPFDTKRSFVASCNRSLESEGSAYRFVNGLITPLTDELEVSEIEGAINSASRPVKTHLRRALELMSSKEAPDYRNSIKESISAVESLVAANCGGKGTLGQLLKKLEREVGLHPALASAMSNLYGYTSDESGIRHAILESTGVTIDEARFFLVICSAFSNFVAGKVAAK